MKKLIAALFGMSMLLTPTMASADTPEGFCQVTATTPKEKNSVSGDYVKVYGSVTWDCAYAPDFGTMDAYLHWRAPGTSTWTVKHHKQDTTLGDAGSMSLEYLPCVKGYHRIWWRYAYREGTTTGGGTGESGTTYLDCRP